MFACPRCRAALARTEAQWACPGCSAAFPDLGTIPCLVPEPQQSRQNWASDAQRFAAMMTASERLFAGELGRPDLPSSTRRRLQKLLDGNQQHRQGILALLSRAGIVAGTLGTELSDPEDARPPDMVRDYDFALRDWAWNSGPEGENQRAVEHLLEAWPTAAPRRVLFLGAGAARLAWDLHCCKRPEVTVALDQSPLNLLLAREALSGAALTLHEFPFAPEPGHEPVVTHCPSQRAATPPGFQLLLADAKAPPFAPAAFDLVVTPWFIDVVDAELARLIGLVHELLAESGSWLNYGPLLYPGYRPVAERRSLAEVVELVELGGFTLSHQGEHDVEHLSSPHDTRMRRERVHAFRADRSAFRAADDALSPPAWQLLSHRPVPADAIRVRPAHHPLLAAVAALVDGQRTTDQIACLLEQHPEFPSDSSARAVTQALLWHLAGVLEPAASVAPVSS